MGRPGSSPASRASVITRCSSSSRSASPEGLACSDQASTCAQTRKHARSFQLALVSTSPRSIRAMLSALPKIETSPRRPSSGPSPYRLGATERDSSATCPRRSPPSTSRWAPIQRTPGPSVIGDSGLRACARLRSARAGGRRLEAEAGQRRAALLAAQQVEERPRERRLPRGGHHGPRGDHPAIAVVGPTGRLLHPLGSRGRVGGVHEAGLDLPTRHVVEHLAYVLREDELPLEAVPESEGAEALLRVLARGDALGIADRDAGHPGLGEVRRLGDV